MKQILILLILTSFALHLRAQQMISVIDDDTHDPIGNALFILDGDTIAYTLSPGHSYGSKASRYSNRHGK